MGDKTADLQLRRALLQCLSTGKTIARAPFYRPHAGQEPSRAGGKMDGSPLEYLALCGAVPISVIEREA